MNKELVTWKMKKLNLTEQKIANYGRVKGHWKEK